MHETIENGVCKRWILQPRVPVFEGQLAGDDGRAGTDAIVEDFQQIVACALIEVLQPPVVE